MIIFIDSLYVFVVVLILSLPSAGWYLDKFNILLHHTCVFNLGHQLNLKLLLLLLCITNTTSTTIITTIIITTSITTTISINIPTVITATTPLSPTCTISISITIGSINTLESIVSQASWRFIINVVLMRYASVLHPVHPLHPYITT